MTVNSPPPCALGSDRAAYYSNRGGGSGSGGNCISGSGSVSALTGSTSNRSRRARCAHGNRPSTPERAHVAGDRGRAESPITAHSPGLRLAAGARGTNHQTSNRPSLIPQGWPGRSIGTRTTRKSHLVTHKDHLAEKDGDLVCQSGGRMKRHELAKVLLDEIVRTRAQLARSQMVLARRTEEKLGRMDQCEECERLWKAYQKATAQSVQLYEELRSVTEDQGLQNLSEATIKAEAAGEAIRGGPPKASRPSGGNRASVKFRVAHCRTPHTPGRKRDIVRSTR
jgi:hypothetical protein